MSDGWVSRHFYRLVCVWASLVTHEWFMSHIWVSNVIHGYISRHFYRPSGVLVFEHWDIFRRHIHTLRYMHAAHILPPFLRTVRCVGIFEHWVIYRRYIHTLRHMHTVYFLPPFLRTARCVGICTLSDVQTLCTYAELYAYRIHIHWGICTQCIFSRHSYAHYADMLSYTHTEYTYTENIFSPGFASPAISTVFQMCVWERRACEVRKYPLTNEIRIEMFGSSGLEVFRVDRFSDRDSVYSHRTFTHVSMRDVWWLHSHRTWLSWKLV